MPDILCENVSFTYATETNDEKNAAIRRVNFAVEKGEFIAVLGRNGSGKSTLAKLLNGIIVPTEGKVTVGGLDTADENNLVPIRKKVGMVFQNPDNQLVSNIVEEDVAFGPENLGIAPDEIRRRVDHALETVGMTEYKKHAPHRLSGGQKQRVAIAGILAMMPECIIFDESTAMLDPQGRTEILDTIRRLNREHGLTVILITHFMNEAAAADRVVVMDAGEIVREGTPKEIFSQVSFLHGVGLDVPQVTELIHLLSEDPSLSERFSFPKGVMDEREAADLIESLYKAK